MTTLTLILGIALVVVSTLYLLDKWKQNQARRDREIVRRFHKYMAQIPPSRPW